MELNNDEIRRYSRHLILPEVGLAGQKKIKGTSVLCIGAGGLGSPIAMYIAAAGIGKIGIVDFDTVDYSNLQRQILHTDADVGRPKAAVGQGNDSRHQSALRSRHPQHAHHVRKRARPHPALRHRGGRHGQFPDALPDERRLRAAEKAECLWLDFPFRGTGERFCAASGRAVLPLSVSRTAAARHGAELRGRRRARRAARHRRLHSGDGNFEARHWPGQFACRPAAAVQRARHEVPRTEIATRPGVSRLRRASDDQGID